MPNIDKNYKSNVPVPKNRRTFNYQTKRPVTAARYWLALSVAVAFVGMFIVGML